MKKQKWTTTNITDLTRKVIIVTGGNSGLGYESVKAFTENGAEVILTCRSVEKGDAAKEEIMSRNPDGKIVVMQLDLMDFDSIRNFAARFKEKYKRLDILLNNAGIMTTPYFLTKDGLEGQTGTNHFGHFALTGLLFDLIKNSPESRVVNVSSLAHKQGIMDFSNLLYEEGKDYSPMKAYGRSKLENLFFTYELQRKFETNGIDSMAVAAHPGVSRTNLGRHMENKWWFRFLIPLFELISQSAAKGALPQIRASVDPHAKGSDYYGPDGFNEMAGFPVLVKSNKESHNKEDARRLWEESEKLTGVSYQF